MSEQQQKSAEKGEELFVLDANHRPGTPGRVHEIPVEWDKTSKEVTRTKTYTLNGVDPVRMPAEHAMKFITDPAFVVADKDGVRIKPVKKRNLYTIGKALGLDENETVCEYEDMTKEALFKRAQTYPGGDLLKPSDGKPLIIEFLKEHQKLAAQVGVSRGSEDVDAQLAAAGGKLPDAMAAKLVGEPTGAIAEVMRRQKSQREQVSA